MTPEVHAALADWVRKGGALVFLGDDSDPYNAVRAWWNDPAKGDGLQVPPRAPLRAARPARRTPRPGEHKVGEGLLIYDTVQPRRPDLSRRRRRPPPRAWPAGPARRPACPTGRRTTWSSAEAPTSSRRASTSRPPTPPIVLQGRFLDLFDAGLPVVESVDARARAAASSCSTSTAPGRAGPAVLASACKVLGRRGRRPTARSGSTPRGPDRVEAVVRRRPARGARRQSTSTASPSPPTPGPGTPADQDPPHPLPQRQPGHRVVIR